MKTTNFAKNEKNVIIKSLTKLVNEKEIIPLTKMELNDLRGGEGEQHDIVPLGK